MTVKDRLNNYIQKKQMEMQTAKNISAQKQADNKRKKINRLRDAKPGWKTDIAIGLATKESPVDFSRRVWNRRKYERENR